MAQQVASTIHDRINRLLDLSIARWDSLPEVEAEIDGWDLLEQIDFVEEWTLEEERLKRLEGFAAAGLLTPDQDARYEQLKRLVTQNRPIIARLRAS